MGSIPWKRQRMNRWENALAGCDVIIRNPGTIYGDDGSTLRPRPLEFRGLLTGQGSTGSRPCLWVKHDGYEHAVVVEHDMTVEAA